MINFFILISTFVFVVIDCHATDIQWSRSLHYSSFFGQRRHRTKKTGFYLSTRANPSSELSANIKAALEQKDYQCHFPYRFKLLKRRGLINVTEQKCSVLEEWKWSFSKENVSVVFATQFMSNPASAFGHTFLMFSPDRDSNNPHPPYLDLTLSYAASMPMDTNGLDYVFKGIFGGFDGKFFDEPFYKRFHEYANMEQRDLWIYPLKLTLSEVDDFLDHVFELSRQNFFPYFFLDDNCSYLTLEIIETIRPNLNLSQDFNLYVLPIESLKTLHHHKLLGAGEFIPSSRSVLIKQFNELSKNDKNDVLEMIKKRETKTATIDAYNSLISYFDNLKVKEHGKLTDGDESFYQKILLKRATLGMSFKDRPKYNGLDPINSHHPLSIQLRAGKTFRKSYQDLELSPLSHRLLSLGDGYIKHSHISFLTPTLRRIENGIRLQKFEFVHLSNLVPYESIDKVFSWKILLERDHAQDNLCSDCSLSRLRGGIGFSFDFNRWLRSYLLPGINVEWGEDIEHHYRGGYGAEFGMIYEGSEKLKTQMFVNTYYTDRWLRARNTITKYSFLTSFNFNQSWSTQLSWSNIHTFPITKINSELYASLTFNFR